ncbi:MAG: lipoyl(octanoyl) transferase LipB [Bdellovibrionaceae bacterium]|jgi:lipoyl(octanoyl) transferase|nr:lipoyl(octanoyl) transferase LipB [Pseudobdellovibrionaceae bacterium]
MIFEDWGFINYQEALTRQLALVEKVNSGEQSNTVVFCSHPPIVTLGRGATKSDLQGWQGDIAEVQRGGRATYHGPGQLVIYLILDLKVAKAIPSQDIGAYLRFLEGTVINAFSHLDIEAYQKDEEIFDESGKKLLMTGVWVNGYKVASMGIALKNWVSYHGIAINIYKDELAFSGINPCGFAMSPMRSLEDLFSTQISRNDLINGVRDSLLEVDF